MRIRRPNVYVLGFFFVAGTLASLAVLLVQVPAFMARTIEPAGPERDEASNNFLLQAGSFITTFRDGKGPWTYTFSQKQINSYFQEHFLRFGDSEPFRKAGITEPRIEFDEDRIRLAFRYGEGMWSTVLSYDVKAWVSSSESNVIVVEFLRCRAGALPAPTQQVFQELTELAQSHNIDIDWYRHETHPVAVLHLQVDRARPSAQINALKASPGLLTIAGVSFDSMQMAIDEPLRAPATPVPALPVSQKQ